jgi:non-heme chloroperoxidase
MPMAGITQREQRAIDTANASRREPVVFIHGLWLLPSSWDRWQGLFQDAGYATLAPGWPDDPETVAQAKENPQVFAGKSIKEVADHLEAVIRQLDRKPAVIGHSFGGLMTQILAGRGLAAVSVAVDPAPFRGVLPLPISALRSAAPALANPLNRGRAVPLSYDQFRYSFANAVSEEEAHHLYETYAVPAPGEPLFQAAAANLNPWTEAKVDTKNPDRGPLLILDGELDHVVPWSIANASFKLQKRNPNVTEIQKIPGRGHALTIDSGWRDVAEIALTFVQRFLPADELSAVRMEGRDTGMASVPILDAEPADTTGHK